MSTSKTPRKPLIKRIVNEIYGPSLSYFDVASITFAFALGLYWGLTLSAVLCSIFVVVILTIIGWIIYDNYGGGE